MGKVLRFPLPGERRLREIIAQCGIATDEDQINDALMMAERDADELEEFIRARGNAGQE